METWLTGEALQHIQTSYGLRVWGAVPMRSVVRLVTDRGRFICKRYDRDKGVAEDRLRAIVDVKTQLERAGLCRSYVSTLAGEPFCHWRLAPVTVEPWHAGRHADFSHPFERMRAMQAVARLHNAQLRIPFALRHSTTILQKLSFRLARADEVANREQLTGISLSEWEEWRRLAEHVLRQLPHRQITALTDGDRAAGVLCHRDLAPHNILMTEGSPARLIDFDLAGADSPIYDLHQLLDHMMYRNPSGEWREEALDAYSRVRPLGREHLAALAALVDFPSVLLREIGELGVAHSDKAKRRAAVRVKFASQLLRQRTRALA